MTVYVLTKGFDRGGDTPMGVYSSKELAEIEKSKYKEDGFTFYEIKPFELDEESEC